MGIGTPEYMAPELSRNGLERLQPSPINTHWAWFCMKWSLVASHTLPIPLPAILLRTGHRTFAASKPICPDLPEKVEKLLLKVLSPQSR